MKKSFLMLIILAFVITTSNAQMTSFDKGYNAGFLKGYCYTTKPNSIFCNPPIPPLPPLPQINENKDNFNDGYHRGFIDGIEKRKRDDYKSSNGNNSNLPQFKPYVSENPLLRFTPEEISAMYQAKANEDQLTAEAIAGLLNLIFTSTPEGRMRRELARFRRKDQKEARKNEILRKREANRLIVGSVKYQNCIKSQKVYLGIAALTGICGTYSFFQGKNYANKYTSATTDAQSIRQKGNTFYQVSPVLFAATGFCILEFALKANKTRHAKVQTLGVSPCFYPKGAGLSLSLNF